MTWLYVPSTSSPCAPASEGSSSESNSLSDISARLAEGSVTWRGKPQPPQAWSRRWRQGGFIELLSGVTCSPSMLDRGVASFISSLRETPVRTTALPESGPAPAGGDSSPQRSAALPRSAGRILSSARTCQGMPLGNSRPSFRHWSDWATSLREEYSARPKPAIPCGASDCSFWPSARAEDSESSGRRHNREVSDTLTAVARDWAAPQAADSKRGSRRSRINRAQEGLPLAEQAGQWPAPAARDWKGSSVGSVTRQDGKSRGDLLDYAAEQFFHRPSSPDQPTRAGQRRWSGSLILYLRLRATTNMALRSEMRALLRMAARSTEKGRRWRRGWTRASARPYVRPAFRTRLNPYFVEALMRWPSGMSGFGRQETAWIQWQLLMRSYLSELCTAYGGEPEQGDLFG
jgi:hypothetical protein